MCTINHDLVFDRYKCALCTRKICDADFVHWFFLVGTGMDGRLTADLQKRVAGFIDVDTEKVGTVYAHHGGQSVPIIHFRDARAREWPFVVCVAMDRTDGRLEANIRSLGLQEGYDYWHFC